MLTDWYLNLSGSSSCSATVRTRSLTTKAARGASLILRKGNSRIRLKSTSWRLRNMCCGNREAQDRQFSPAHDSGVDRQVLQVDLWQGVKDKTPLSVEEDLCVAQLSEYRWSEKDHRRHRKHQAPLHDQNALWIGAAIERTDQSGDSRYWFCQDADPHRQVQGEQRQGCDAPGIHSDWSSHLLHPA